MNRMPIILLCCLSAGAALAGDARSEVSGPSADELRPDPKQAGDVIETRDLGEADAGGRIEMPERWGENERTPDPGSAPDLRSGRAMATLFARLDVDHDGQLDRTEARSNAAVYRHFPELDTNADDAIDDGEFRRMNAIPLRLDTDGGRGALERGTRETVPE